MNANNSLRNIHTLFRYFKRRLKYLYWFFNHQKPNTKIKNVHLGCGEINHPNFINVDLLPFKHVHFLHKVESLNMFKDNELDLIYISHCLEHISHTQIEFVLSEYYRKLKLGGVLRISVPDFEVILQAYDENAEDLEKLMVVLYGGQDYDFNYHYAIFDKFYLKSLLKRVGFSQVQEWKHEHVWHKNIDDWSNKSISLNGKDYFISLNIEAIK